MSTWTLVTPSVNEIRAMLAAYGCTATVRGSQIVVTHSSGTSDTARTPDEALRKAIELARRV